MRLPDISPEQSVEDVDYDEIVPVGTVKFNGANSSHATGDIAVIDAKNICLVFPIAPRVEPIFRKERSDYSDHYIMDSHLRELTDAGLHHAFLQTIADAHDIDDMSLWSVSMGYVEYPPTSSVQRIMVFVPPDDCDLTPADYVLPLLTRARIHGGKFVDIEFDSEELEGT